MARSASNIRSYARWRVQITRAAACLVAALCLAASARAERSTGGEEELLPIHETAAERALRAFFPPPSPRSADPPPVPPVRGVAEYEPCTGVLVRYPLGIPYSLVHALAQDVTLHVVVSAANQASAVASFQAQGVNMARVEWVVAPNNSIWTRDYGPWFAFDGSGRQVILDHYYNRPARPDDNDIPIVLGETWGIPVVTHDLWHAGGNYMTEGDGTSFSSDLVWTENAARSPAQIAQFMFDYYGVDDYRVLPDIALTGIHHIDTWGKLLDEETVLMKRLAPDHPDHARLEANAAAVAGTMNRYGRPFKVLRVDCPEIASGDVAAYTNSLILNGRVLVPVFNVPGDAAALQAYRDAMPGYEVIGFAHSGWISDDALHCRVLGIHDRYMLRVDHDPVRGARAGQPVEVLVYADDRSESGLDLSATALRWRVSAVAHRDGTRKRAPVAGTAVSFAAAAFTATATPDVYRAVIPPQGAGTEVEYYVTAVDHSGRTVSRPRPAPEATYRFRFDTATGVPGSPRPLALAAAPNPFRDASRLFFVLESARHARLSVYDVRGREVARLADGPLSEGSHEFRWRGRDAAGAPLPAGVYFARLDVEGERVTRRLVLLR